MLTLNEALKYAGLPQKVMEATGEKAIQAVLKQINKKGYECLSLEEREATNIDDDTPNAGILKAVLKVKFPAISDYKSRKVSDDGQQGIEADFKLEGKSYSVTWWPEAGDIYVVEG